MSDEDIGSWREWAHVRVLAASMDVLQHTPAAPLHTLASRFRREAERLQHDRTTAALYECQGGALPPPRRQNTHALMRDTLAPYGLEALTVYMPTAATPGGFYLPDGASRGMHGAGEMGQSVMYATMTALLQKQHRHRQQRQRQQRQQQQEAEQQQPEQTASRQRRNAHASHRPRRSCSQSGRCGPSGRRFGCVCQTPRGRCCSATVAQALRVNGMCSLLCPPRSDSVTVPAQDCVPPHTRVVANEEEQVEDCWSETAAGAGDAREMWRTCMTMRHDGVGGGLLFVFCLALCEQELQPIVLPLSTPGWSAPWAPCPPVTSIHETSSSATTDGRAPHGARQSRRAQTPAKGVAASSSMHPSAGPVRQTAGATRWQCNAVTALRVWVWLYVLRLIGAEEQEGECAEARGALDAEAHTQHWGQLRWRRSCTAPLPQVAMLPSPAAAATTTTTTTHAAQELVESDAELLWRKLDEVLWHTVMHEQQTDAATHTAADTKTTEAAAAAAAASAESAVSIGDTIATVRTRLAALMGCRCHASAVTRRMTCAGRRGNAPAEEAKSCGGRYRRSGRGVEEGWLPWWRMEAEWHTMTMDRVERVLRRVTGMLRVLVHVALPMYALLSCYTCWAASVDTDHPAAGMTDGVSPKNDSLGRRRRRRRAAHCAAEEEDSSCEDGGARRPDACDGEEASDESALSVARRVLMRQLDDALPPVVGHAPPGRVRSDVGGQLWRRGGGQTTASALVDGMKQEEALWGEVFETMTREVYERTFGAVYA